jgi:glutamate decarboxylase
MLGGLALKRRWQRRNGFSHDLADLFLGHVERLLPRLERQPAPFVGEDATSFHH